MSLALTPDRRRERVQQIIVRHLSGTHAGRVETFGVEPGGVLTIGRDPEANIRLDSYRDGTVSRHHARIIAHATGTIWLELVDRESSNGTFLNTRWLRGRIALVPGDRIRLGVGGPELEFDIQTPAVDGTPGVT